MPDSNKTVTEGPRVNRWWSFAAGVIMIIGGIEALAAPFLAALVAALWVAWGLVFGGVAELISAFSSAENRVWKGLRGVLYLVAGIYILRSPGTGLVVLALMLGWLLWVQGAISLAGALQLRPRP